jgi:hypothetical protein
VVVGENKERGTEEGYGDEVYHGINIKRRGGRREEKKWDWDGKSKGTGKAWRSGGVLAGGGVVEWYGCIQRRI